MQNEKEKKKTGTSSGLQTIKVVDGKYQIKNKLLGEGSFAKTYLAIDNATEQ